MSPENKSLIAGCIIVAPTAVLLPSLANYPILQGVAVGIAMELTRHFTARAYSRAALDQKPPCGRTQVESPMPPKNG